MKNLFNRLNQCIAVLFLLFTFTSSFAADKHSLTDSQIINVIMVIDKNEVAVANTVLRNRKLDKETLEYAQYLKQQHLQNLSEAKKLAHKLDIKPATSKLSNSLQMQGKKDLKQFQHTKKNALALDYINAMIKGHEGALDVIHNLESDTNNSDLKQFLADTSKHVAHHLERAKEIKNHLA